tara:strand:+ start:18473 stop:18691 length:219 start_codon:yes stop_codon:yes gene_type:complete
MKNKNSKTGKRQISQRLLDKIDVYWRAANYLSVGQIYLRDNPVMWQRLKQEQIKPMLVDHFWDTQSQNFMNN